VGAFERKVCPTWEFRGEAGGGRERECERPREKFLLEGRISSRRRRKKKLPSTRKTRAFSEEGTAFIPRGGSSIPEEQRYPFQREKKADNRKDAASMHQKGGGGVFNAVKASAGEQDTGSFWGE